MGIYGSFDILRKIVILKTVIDIVLRAVKSIIMSVKLSIKSTPNTD